MSNNFASLRLPRLWRAEFTGYNWSLFQRDLLAGLTVGAVALPLALAFGVASGATPAAGLVTAVLAGLVIALFGGARFQISGPTGAMSAILIGLTGTYGMSGVWVAGFLAGVILVILGLLRMGRYISLIPTPVITGFTSGIALIIAVGQLDTVMGVKLPAENTLAKLVLLATRQPVPDWRAMAAAGIVAATMIALPRLTTRVPGSLVGLVAATAATSFAGWNITVIGAIPRTILLDDRFSLANFPWAQLDRLIPAAVAVAALGAIETLLCGAVASKMSATPIDNNQELIGQGLGNIAIPFFGGVPATAAIARTSVAIKSGGASRLVSFVHSGILLLSALALGDVIGQVPLAALGGVLMVTAWRMNEWELIRFYTRGRIKHALGGFAVTLAATVALDLTQAILIGIGVSSMMYLRQSASAVGVIDEAVDLDKIRGRGYPLERACPDIHIYYITGPLFFASVATIMNIVHATHRQYRTIVISLRGVPMVDVMGIEALEHLVKEQRKHGGDVFLTSLHPAVRRMMDRTGFSSLLGGANIYWNAVEATVAAHNRHAVKECPHCQGMSAIRVHDQPRPTEPAVAPDAR